MKASELIKKLMDLYLEHGDIEVVREDGYMHDFGVIYDNPRITYKHMNNTNYGFYSKEENKGDKIIVI